MQLVNILKKEPGLKFSNVIYFALFAKISEFNIALYDLEK